MRTTKETIVDALRSKYEALAPVMDERVCRLWAAAEAQSLGQGGAAIVHQATGISGRRIWEGKKELAEIKKQDISHDLKYRRIRRSGGGRKRLTEKDLTLLRDLELLINPATRGSPESQLCWTTKSVRHLADELRTRGHKVSSDTVDRLLHQLGYSLQAPRKEEEGANHPDRDAQFRYIDDQAQRFQSRGQSVISVDTKKKELVGNFKRSGREWYPKGQSPQVNTYDFPTMAQGKAIPYGVYDIARDEGWVNVGVDHDTPQFAVESIRRWWLHLGCKFYPKAKELLIIADAGGSNSVRSRLWKKCLQELADETRLKISVCHFPPGTSKWNKIEHRLFSQITINCRGQSFTSYETIISLIGNTKTRTGLRVQASLDDHKYPTGVNVSKEDFSELKIRRKRFHGDWNYSLSPRRSRSS